MSELAPAAELSHLFGVRGKVALVTGGSRGIGLMIARALTVSGACVYISSRNADACTAVAEELSRSGRCIALPADLSTWAGADALASQLRRHESELDILVNNAGTTWGAPIEEHPEAAFDKVWAVNIKAPFRLVASLLPELRSAASADDPARVVNIGSVDGLVVSPTENYSYSASKAALHHLTRQLADRLVNEHVVVNAIAPGPFDSKMMAFLLDDPAGRAAMERRVPLGRIGREEDIAGAVLFLCSRAGSYLTGTVLPVDGGLSTLGAR